MATTQKKKTAKKSTATKKTAPKGRAASSQKSKLSETVKREIWGIALIACAILIFIGVLNPQSGGAIGTTLSGFFIALAGKGAIAIPIFLAVWGVLIFMDKNNRRWDHQMTGLAIVFFVALTFFHISVPLTGFAAYLGDAAKGTGGGIFGAFFAWLLLSAFDRTWSIVILTALAVIGLLLATEGSLWHWVKKSGDSVGEALSHLREEREERREERAHEQPLPTMNPAPEEEPRPMPPIFSHDDPVGMAKPATPIVEEPMTEPETAPPPPLNRFAKSFLPTISPAAEQDTDEPEGAQAIPMDRPIAAKENALPKREAGENPLAEETGAEPLARMTENEELAYQLPPVELMSAGVKIKNPRMNKAITDAIAVLEETLENFGVKARVSQVVAGPAVTRYELQPAPGVKVSRITSLADDIALSLAAPEVRIEAPIPGKSAVGIEVPRPEIATVYFRDVIETEEFQNSNSKITLALGKNISGEPIVGDLSKMPHLLIAGATGSGKSICINSIICSFLYKAKPDELKLMLIDPKKVELAGYNSLPHLITPVVTDNKKAAGCLKWAVKEMEDRYSLFAANGVKDFHTYNLRHPENILPQMVIIIDELADLMMVAPADVEESICRLAQMARAAGIHLIVATQRPSVDVITGLIKANIPSRIAFAVSSHTDSRTILDMGGAEKLLGKGDMLYHPVGIPKPMRVQGTYIDEKDIHRLVEYCCRQAAPKFYPQQEIEAAAASVGAKGAGGGTAGDESDPLFFEAAKIIYEDGQASTSRLQRRLRVGNPRAGRLIDILEDKGVISGPDGAKPRNILMSWDEFVERFGEP